MKIGPSQLVSTLLLMAVPLSAWWFVFKPNDARNQEMLLQIETRRAKLNELNRTTGMMGNLRQEIGSLEQAIETLQSKLPSEKEIDRVLHEIWALAKKCKLTTLSVETLNNKSDKVFTGSSSEHSEQPVRIVVDGNFLGFYAFLQELENRPRIMRIHKVDLSKSRKNPEGFIRGDFIMSIFFEKEDKAQT